MIKAYNTAQEIEEILKKKREENSEFHRSILNDFYEKQMTYMIKDKNKARDIILLLRILIGIVSMVYFYKERRQNDDVKKLM
jgi:hypothetical protein